MAPAGNIAGDSAETRKQLVANGAIRALAGLVIAARGGAGASGGLALLQAAQIAAWALSNVIKGAGQEVRAGS